jgi:hypothetical protein
VAHDGVERAVGKRQCVTVSLDIDRVRFPLTGKDQHRGVDIEPHYVGSQLGQFLGDHARAAADLEDVPGLAQFCLPVEPLPRLPRPTGLVDEPGVPFIRCHK